MQLFLLNRAVSWPAVLGRCALGVVVTASSLALQASAAIIIDGYTPGTNDRFTNDPSFIMNGFDISGVGQQSVGGGLPSRWATAISRNVVISAWHFRPSTSQPLYFYENNDPNGTPITRNVLSNARIGNTDFALSVLDSNLPSSIAHYDFARDALTAPEGPLGSAGAYQGSNAFMFGVSPESHLAQQDQAVGRNIISGYLENVPANIGSDVDLLALLRDAAGSSDHVDFEAYLQTGDSSGPLFAMVGGNLRLLGVNSVIGKLEIEGVAVDFSGISYIGNHGSFVDTFIIENAVPEPTSAALLGVAISSCAWVRRRRA